MASLGTMCFRRGTNLSSTLGPSLLKKTVPAVSVLPFPKKTIVLTSTNPARIYGPEGSNPASMTHWKMERYISMALLPLIPSAVLFPNPVLDQIGCLALVLHTHWGLQSVFTDYIHGQILPKIANNATLLVSILAFGGFCYFNLFDVGLGKAVQLMFTQL